MSRIIAAMIIAMAINGGAYTISKGLMESHGYKLVQTGFLQTEWRNQHDHTR